MTAHVPFLELAAAAIDFELTQAERTRLERHLASCPACRAGAGALHADARSLASLPPVRLPARRADELLATALHPGVVRHPLRLLAVAALLGLLLVGSIAIGTELLRRAQDDLSVVLPVPSVSLDPDASPVADNGIGTSWERVEIPEGASMGGVIAGGPGAIAWGTSSSSGPSISYSSDGRDWRVATVEQIFGAADWQQSGHILSVTTGGPGLVAVGSYDRQGVGRTALVWTSVDGVEWSLVPPDPVFDQAVAEDVIAWRGEVFAYGHESTGPDEGDGRQLLWTSRDGLAWQREALTVPDAFRSALPIASGDRLWAFGRPIAFDPEGSWTQTRWLTSTDGRTWSASSLPRYPGTLFPQVGGLLTLVQPSPIAAPDFTPPPASSDRPDSGIYRSTDLETWQPLSRDLSVMGYELIEVGGTLVIVGDDSAGDPECWADCQAMGWRSIDGGVTWQAVPADVAGGTMIDVAALPDGTLVAVGRLLDDKGTPSPAAWVSVPAKAPAPSPAASPSEPNVARIRCETNGTTTVETPVVRPQVDGVHIVTVNETGLERALDVDGVGGDNAGLGSTETVWAVPPRTVRVACYDSSAGPAPADAYVELTVVDPDGAYVPTDLDCTDMTVGSNDYPAGAPGWAGDPVDLTRAALAKSHPSFAAEAAGYAANDTRQVRVLDAGRPIARLAWVSAGTDTWLLDSVTTCSGVQLDLDLAALDGTVAGPSPSPAPSATIGAAWARSTLAEASVPAIGGGGMDGVIVGGPGAIAWGQVYGEVSRIWTTTDGHSWQRSTVEAPAEPDPDSDMPGHVRSMTAGGPGYVAAGWYDRAGTGRRGVVWTSVDGRSWDLVPHDPVFENVLISGVIAWRGELLAYGVRSFGPDEGGGDQLAWSSSDGLTWKAVQASIPAGFRRGDPVAAGALLWADGTPADEAAALDARNHRWLSSSDGRTWSVAALPYQPGRLFAAAGGLLSLTSATSSAGLYRSADLATWQTVTQDLGVGASDIVEIGRTLVVVGDDSGADSPCPDACWPTGWRSPNAGATWKAVAADDVHGTILHVAALPDGTLVGVGRVFDAGAEVSPAAWVSPPS